MLCTNCGVELENTKFCAKCYLVVKEMNLPGACNPEFCLNCGAELSENAKIYEFCDKRVYTVFKLREGVGDPELMTGLWVNYVAMGSSFRFSMRELREFVKKHDYVHAKAY